MKPFVFSLLLLICSVVPAFTDNPAMGPYGSSVVWGPEVTSPLVAASVLGLSPAISSHLTVGVSDWDPARKAGICVIHFLNDGSGIRVGIQIPGACRIGPVISFHEFRRRMETP